LEHLHHFGLAADPFRNEPRLELFSETAPHVDALRRLERGVRQHKGLCVLIGEVGAGKTMIVRQLHERLEEEVFESIALMILKGEADVHWLLRRFAAQLGVEELPSEREALLAQVYERLAIVREDGRHTVLLIDDAQGLASTRTLSELCGLLKLEYEERPLLSMVLAGVSALDQALTGDPVLARRADVKVRIAPLDEEGTSLYLQRRIEAAQGSAAIFDSSAIKALYQLGGGFPGPINTLADNALYEAFLAGRSQVLGSDVERAHDDLGWEGSTSTPVSAAPVCEIEVGVEAEADGEAGVARAPKPSTETASVLEMAIQFPGAPEDAHDLIVDLIDD
jgi:general secretion pathway protein A